MKKIILLLFGFIFLSGTFAIGKAEINADGSINEWGAAIEVKSDSQNVIKAIISDFNITKREIYIGLKGKFNELNKGILSVYIGKNKALSGSNFYNTDIETKAPFMILYELRIDLSSGKCQLLSAKADKEFEPMEDYQYIAKEKDIEIMIPFSLLNIIKTADIQITALYLEENKIKEIIPTKNSINLSISSIDSTSKILGIFKDPIGDANGAGITLPFDKVFSPESFDISSFIISRNKKKLIFTIEFAGNIENPWDGPLGFSIQMIDIYIDKDKSSFKTRTLPGRNVEFKNSMEWEYCISVDGWNASIRNKVYSKIENANINVKTLENRIIISIPEELIGKYNKEWQFNVLVLPFDGNSSNRIRKFIKTATQWEIGTGNNNPAIPHIIDMLDQGNQKKILSIYSEKSLAKIRTFPLKEE